MERRTREWDSDAWAQGFAFEDPIQNKSVGHQSVLPANTLYEEYNIRFKVKYTVESCVQTVCITITKNKDLRKINGKGRNKKRHQMYLYLCKQPHSIFFVQQVSIFHFT